MQFYRRLAFTLLSIFLTAVSAYGQPVPSWSAQSPYMFSDSIHSIIKSGRPSSVTQILSSECLQNLRALLEKDSSFEAEKLNRLVIPLGSFLNENTRQGHFYHFSFAKEMVEISRRSSFGDIFEYLRRPNGNDIFWYVSTDTNSASKFGNIKLKVVFSPETPVLMSAGDLPGFSTDEKELKNAIEDELVNRYPELKSCRQLSVDDRALGVLTLLAAEARGVGLIAYFGVENRKAGFLRLAARNAQWFQVLGPWAIQEMHPE